MNREGAEAARRSRATPPALPQAHAGCAITVVVVAAGLAVTVYRTGSVLASTLLLPVLTGLVAVAGNWLRNVLLLARARRQWAAAGVSCLVVYSDSPAWQERVQSEWLSRLGSRAVALNRSHPSPTRTLEESVFQRFCGTTSNFSPAIVVFRGLRHPFVFRFYYAFQEAKHGNVEYLHHQEREAFAALRLDGPEA